MCVLASIASIQLVFSWFYKVLWDAFGCDLVLYKYKLIELKLMLNRMSCNICRESRDREESLDWWVHDDVFCFSHIIQWQKFQLAFLFYTEAAASCGNARFITAEFLFFLLLAAEGRQRRCRASRDRRNSWFTRKSGKCHLTLLLHAYLKTSKRSIVSMSTGTSWHWREERPVGDRCETFWPQRWNFTGGFCRLSRIFEHVCFSQGEKGAKGDDGAKVPQNASKKCFYVRVWVHMLTICFLQGEKGDPGANVSTFHSLSMLYVNIVYFI